MLKGLEWLQKLQPSETFCLSVLVGGLGVTQKASESVCPSGFLGTAGGLKRYRFGNLGGVALWGLRVAAKVASQ